MVRIAINGFGRIGRNFFRAVWADAQARKKLDIVAINIGPADRNTIAHMTKYDTLLGIFPGTIALEGDYLLVDGKKIKIVAERDPACAPWKELAIDWVVESSGLFTQRSGAQKHLDAGAGAVLITAPAQDEDVAIIPGVNDDMFDPEKHTIVSLGSCTTNAIIPMLKMMHESFGVVSGAMTSIHSYTNTQVLLDTQAGDLRRSRAAALNIIPTTTGATKMLKKVMPELDGKVSGVAVRVPVAKVSIIDLSFVAQKQISVNAIHEVCKKYAQGSMQGFVDLSMEPLVSSDYSGTHYSVVIDGLLTNVQENLANIFGWYDNEWGYSVRLKDFLVNTTG